MSQTRIQGDFSSTGLILNRLAQAPSWQVGQVLNAKVMAVDPSGEITLRLFNQTLQIHSDLPFKTGQELKLLVKQVESQILLELVPTPRRDTTRQQPINDALRQNLPLQRPLQPLLNTLVQLAEGKQLDTLLKTLGPVDWSRLTSPTPPTGSTAQPRATQPVPGTSGASVGEQLQRIGALIRQLAQELPSPRDLTTAQGLRKALGQSGLWLEAKLAFASSTGMGTGPDLKAGLLRLTGLLQQTLQLIPLPTAPAQNTLAPIQQQALLQLRELLGQLRGETEGALARLKLVQLQNSPGTQLAQEAQWLLELPLRQPHNGEVVQLQIRREPDEQEVPPGQQSWSINLAFDNAQHGPFHIQLHLLGNTLSATIYAERQETAERFRLQLGDLQHRLETIGLETGQLSSRVGSLPAIIQLGRQLSSLIDTCA